MSAYILDTECTGTDHEVDQVIELAWQRAALPGQKLEPLQFHSRYKPSVPIKWGALATHHILESDLQECTGYQLARLEVPKDAEYWIGHNIDYDWRMLGEPDVKRIDNLALARFLLPHLDSHTQSALIYYIGHRLGAPERARERLQNAHTAAADVANAATIFHYLICLADKQGTDVSSWDAVWRLSEHARVPSVMTFGKFKGQHMSQVDEGYRTWYKKEANQDPYILKAFEMYRFGDVIA